MHKNTLIYYVTEFLGALTFGLPISTFFFTIHLGFSIGWAIFITSLVGFTAFLFEIPTGSWADRFGRKRMYIAGLTVAIFGLSFYLWARTIPLFILASIIIGLSAAIMSGNIEVLLHDNLVERWEEEKYKEVQTNGYTFFFSGRVVACLLGGVLFTVHPLLPYALTFAVMCAILPIFLLIDEPRQELSHEKDDRSHVRSAFKSILKRPDLVYLLGGLIIMSSVSNTYWFSYQPYLNHIGFSISFIGGAYALASATSALWSNTLKKFLKKKLSELQILQYMWIIFVLMNVGFALFAKNPSILGVIPMVANGILGGVTISLGNSYILKDIPATQKSAALSIFSFGITLGYFTFSAFIGFFIDRFSLPNIYLFVGALSVLLFIANFIISRRFVPSRHSV